MVRRVTFVLLGALVAAMIWVPLVLAKPD